MEVVLAYVIWILVAVWCKNIAKRNGRNTTVALVLGLFFGILAVAFYYLLGSDSDQ